MEYSQFFLAQIIFHESSLISGIFYYNCDTLAFQQQCPSYHHIFLLRFLSLKLLGQKLIKLHHLDVDSSKKERQKFPCLVYISINIYEIHLFCHVLFYLRLYSEISSEHQQCSSNYDIYQWLKYKEKSLIINPKLKCRYYTKPNQYTEKLQSTLKNDYLV